MHPDPLLRDRPLSAGGSASRGGAGAARQARNPRVRSDAAPVPAAAGGPSLPTRPGLASGRCRDGAPRRVRRGVGEPLRVDDALVARHRDEVRDHEPRGGARRRLCEHRGGGRIFSAAGRRVLRSLTTEQDDVIGALGDRQGQLGGRVQRLADRGVSAAVLGGALDQRERAPDTPPRSPRPGARRASAGPVPAQSTPRASVHSGERRAAEAIRPAAIATTTPETAPAPGAGDGPAISSSNTGRWRSYRAQSSSSGRRSRTASSSALRGS